jgi:hypothetical protein
MTDWWYRCSRDNAFPVLCWIGTWRVFDWVESFQGWLDDTLPWRLRSRLAAMWQENRDLCTKLQTSQDENFMLKNTLREALKKMHMPLRGLYPIGKVHERENDIGVMISVDFERYRPMMMFDNHTLPYYSPNLLDYVARQTAENMVTHMQEHVYKEVKKIYEKHFLGEIDGS